MRKIRWGIIGAGHIARSFAQDVHVLADAEMLAVSSRSTAHAQQFAEELSIPRAYGSYGELVADPDIDIVYVATPHVFHKEQSLLCLKAGKAVLVEKPFTTSAAEAREVITSARQRNLFCMEAMWMRFIPAMRQAVELVKSGAIGEIQMITASLGIRCEYDPKHRLFDPNLGGGAMLDLGVYPLSLIVQLLGRPSTITSQAQIGATHVDEHAAALLGFPEGQVAVLSTNIRAQNGNDALIMGSLGTLHIRSPLYRPTTLTLCPYASHFRTMAKSNSLIARLKTNRFVHNTYRQFNGVFLRLRGDNHIQVACEGNGYGYEAAEAGRCLLAGRTESSIMSLDETMVVMEAMDTIREQWFIPSGDK